MNKKTNKQTNKQANQGNVGDLCGQISGGVKRSVKSFSFVLFIHYCKTIIKADQKSSFYPSVSDILYQIYLKKIPLRQWPLYDATNKCVYRYLKLHPVSSFALRISGLHTFGRKQRFLRFSTVHHGMYGSIYESSRHRQVFLLSCDLDASI